MKKIALTMSLLLLASSVYAADKNTFSDKEVREFCAKNKDKQDAKGLITDDKNYIVAICKNQFTESEPEAEYTIDK